MDFKFIVLAFVISAATGEEPVLKKLEYPVGFTNKSLSLDIINHSDVAAPSAEKVAPEGLNNISRIFPNFKPISVDKTNTNITTPEKIVTTDPNTTMTSTTITTTTPGDGWIGGNPTTPPLSEEGQWKVQNKTGGVCIFVQMELKFNVTYPGTGENIKNNTIFVPKNSKPSGNCSDSSQNLQLTWDKGNYFEMVFGLNKTSNKFEIRLLNLTINVTGFKDIDVSRTYMTYLSKKVEFPAVPVKMSYKCDKEQIQQLNSTENLFSAKMFMSHAQLEAFMSKKDAAFSEAEDCEGFETPDIVPIAVGCVLSILVVIVLVAYLIGRRRAVNRGYLSM